MEMVLTFRLGEEVYGLEVTQVQEIVEAPVLDYIPRAPRDYLGAMNFHGSILPVLDLGARLGFGQGERDGRVVVLPPAVGFLALAITRLGRIVPLEREHLLPCRQERERETFIREIYDRDGELINLLDLERLLSSLAKDR